ncbi:LCP family protein [Tepidibacillus infernus]|uniref:LCP family protein n=1 Tax=Tepidibacillus infernus TaxID=1806172 RepID=UPI003A1E967E
MKHHKWVKGLIIFVTIIGLGLGSIIGYASWKINQFFEKTSETAEKPNINNMKQDSEQDKRTEKPFAILLLGEDYRPETHSLNTDAIIVSVWNPVTKKVYLLSIPRDTKVKIPDYGYAKVNSTFAKGGPILAMETLSDLLDIPIQYYATVDFKGFEAVIDELGGIEIDVDRNMVYHSLADGTDINLKKGLQVLNGKQALDYARFRKSSVGKSSDDFERNQRHQKILKALADKMSSFKGITNVFDILDVAGDHIKTNLTPDEMKKLVWDFKGANKDSIQTIEMNSYWKTPYVYIDDQELAKVQEKLKNAYAITKTEETELSQPQKEDFNE